MAQVELARALESDQRDAAIAEAQAATDMLDRLGAVRERDAAVALVRRLGGKARTGPKNLGDLTRRETEVLRLVGEGLTNAEARLAVVHHHEDCRPPRQQDPDEARGPQPH